MSESFPVLELEFESACFFDLLGETEGDRFQLLLEESLGDRECLRELDPLRDLRDQCFGDLELGRQMPNLAV